MPPDAPDAPNAQLTPPPEDEECKLISGTFATLIQMLLGVIALFVLAMKRYYEVPQRPVKIWAFDASKQMVGAGFAHVANLIIALFLYQHHHDEGTDQCALYFVNFTLDTTVGVFFNWLLLSGFTKLARHFGWASVLVPGDYGNPIRISIWLKQLTSWIVVIWLAKVLIALLILLFEKPLNELAAFLFAPLKPYPRAELVLVMVACPCLMNALQFWVQDNFLKKDVLKVGKRIKLETSDSTSKETMEREVKASLKNNQSPQSPLSPCSSSSCSGSGSGSGSVLTNSTSHLQEIHLDGHDLESACSSARWSGSEPTPTRAPKPKSTPTSTSIKRKPTSQSLETP